MATSLGKVRCQHRCTKSQFRARPSVPTLLPDDDEQEYYSNLQIEWSTCKRCGCARLRRL